MPKFVPNTGQCCGDIVEYVMSKFKFYLNFLVKLQVKNRHCGCLESFCTDTRWKYARAIQVNRERHSKFLTAAYTWIKTMIYFYSAIHKTKTSEKLHSFNINSDGGNRAFLHTLYSGLTWKRTLSAILEQSWFIGPNNETGRWSANAEQERSRSYLSLNAFVSRAACTVTLSIRRQKVTWVMWRQFIIN